MLLYFNLRFVKVFSSTAEHQPNLSRSSAFELVVLTLCPPGPDERMKFVSYYPFVNSMSFGEDHLELNRYRLIYVHLVIIYARTNNNINNNWSMQSINFQPQVPSVVDFQKQYLKKKKRQRQLDEIATFNNKQQQVKKGKDNDEEFNSTGWESISKQNDKKEDFFEIQGKTLLGESKSIKYLNSLWLTIDTVAHFLIGFTKILIGFTFWHWIIDTLIIIVNFVHLVHKWKVHRLAESYHTKDHCRKMFHNFYHYCLLLSIALCGLQGISITYVALQTKQINFYSILMGIGLITSIYIEIRLLQANRYILWMEGQINRRQVILSQEIEMN